MIATGKTSNIRNFFAGGALFAALAAAGGFAAIRGGSDSNDSTPPPAVVESKDSSYTYSQQSDVRGKIVFYIVETAEQEATVREAEAQITEDLAATDAPGYRSFGVYRVTTPEESVAADLSIGASMEELALAGTADVEVVDYRNR